MKSRKTRMFAALGLVAISGFSLMVASAAVTEKTIKSDLTNAIQRIPRVRIVSKDYVKGSTLTNLGQLFRINTEGNGFALGNPNSRADGASATVLGGRANTANSSHSTIIGGDNNTILGSSAATILGGRGNMLGNDGYYGTIVGGSENKISKVRYATIVGTNNSITGSLEGLSYDLIVGNNSSVFNSSGSVALGESSINRARSSFLWTDSNHTDALGSSNTFAVVSDRGMVVNKDKAHDFAKLTIGGSLIIDNSSHNPVCDSERYGVLKVVPNTSNAEISCFCSCAGSGRTSLFGAGVCSSSCQDSITPRCGNEVIKICNATGYVYSGSCVEGEVVEGTGAYIVEDNGKIHRTCQTNNGAIASCQTGGTSREIGSCNHNPIYQCMGEYDHATQLPVPGILTYEDRLTSQLFNSQAEAQAEGAKCAWVCDPGRHKMGNRCVEYSPCNANSHFGANEIFQGFVGFDVPTMEHGTGGTFYREQEVDGGVRKCSGHVSCNDSRLILDSHNGCPLTENCSAQTIGTYSVPALKIGESGTAYDTGYVYSNGNRGKTQNANTEGYYSCTQGALCDDGTPSLVGSPSCTYGCYAITKSGYNVPALNNNAIGVVRGGNPTDIIVDNEVVGKRICDGEFECNNGVVNYRGEVNCREEIDPCEPQTIDGYEITTYIANGEDDLATKTTGVGACTKVAHCSYGKIELRGEAICNLACKAGENPQGEGVVKGSANYQDEGHTPDAWTYTPTGVLGACEWRCDSTHVKNGNKCDPVTTYTTCKEPEPSGEGVETGDNTYPAQATQKTWTYTPTGVLGACEWRCDSEHEKDGNGCKPKTTYTTCGGDAPALGSEGLMAGDSTYPAQATQKTWTYTPSGTLGACEWRCDSEHEKDGNGCRPKSPCSGPCGGVSNGGTLTCYQPGVKCTSTTTKAGTEGPKTCTDGGWYGGNFTHNDYTDLSPVLLSETCEGYTVEASERDPHGIYTECTKYSQNGTNNSCKSDGKMYKFDRCEDDYELEGDECVLKTTSYECGLTINSCQGGGVATSGEVIGDNEYHWYCGSNVCGMCEGGMKLELEEFNTGKCDRTPRTDLVYCPDTCDEIYNSDKTNVDPTCLNGAIVTGSIGARPRTLIPDWNGDTVKRGCVTSTGYTENCELNCPRCTGTTGTNVVLNNNNAPSTSTAYSYNTNTNLACTYRCKNGYYRVYNRYTYQYECKDVDHYEWRFYAPDDTSYSNPQSSISWTVGNPSSGVFEERAQIFGAYFSLTNARTEFTETYEETDSDGNDSGGQSVYVNPNSNLTHGVCTFWNINSFKWNIEGENYVSRLMGHSYSLSNYSTLGKTITINLSSMYNAIPIMDGVNHPGYSLSSSFRFNWGVAAYRRIDLTFNSSQPSETKYYANSYAGRTLDLFGYMIWGGVRDIPNNVPKDHEACVYAIEPVSWEHIKAVSEPVYYGKCSAGNVEGTFGSYYLGAGDHGDGQRPTTIYQGCEYENYFRCNDGTWVEEYDEPEPVDYSCQPGCFLAGTRVLTQDGSKNIEDIEAGDIVLSYNTDTNSYEYQPVVEKYVHEDNYDELYELTIDGNKLEVTSVHRFYVKVDDNGYQCVLPYKWEAASRLKVGDQLLMADGTYVTIENITHHPNRSTVYNFQVENNHNYFVGEGYLVHNMKYDNDPYDPYDPYNPNY